MLGKWSMQYLHDGNMNIVEACIQVKCAHFCSLKKVGQSELGRTN